jgi:hypothetical protein
MTKKRKVKSRKPTFADCFEAMNALVLELCEAVKRLSQRADSHGIELGALNFKLLRRIEALESAREDKGEPETACVGVAQTRKYRKGYYVLSANVSGELTIAEYDDGWMFLGNDDCRDDLGGWSIVTGPFSIQDIHVPPPEPAAV